MGGHKDYNKSRCQPQGWGEYFVADAGRLYRYPIYKRTVKRMEAKILIWAANAIGLPSFLVTFLNAWGWVRWDWLTGDNWKTTVLTVIAALWAVAKIIFYCIRQYDMHLLRRKKLKDDL
jgi:hypothetical protein